VGNGNGNGDGNGDCNGDGDAASSLFIVIASLYMLCLPSLHSPPSLPSSPNPLTSLAHPFISHPPWSPSLVNCCMFMGWRSKHDDFVIACAPPPPLSSSSPSTYLACPTIVRHALLGHHGWLIVIFKGGWKGECAFYHNRLVAGQSPGCKLCMHASFFDKTAPTAKKSNKPRSPGHVESDSTCPDDCQIMN
jgi:hypothetical protein